MTIHEPQKNKFRLNAISVMLLALIAGEILGGVYTYQEVVNLKHDIEDFDTEIAALEAENAELRNELNHNLSPKQLKDLAKRLGLIQERTPIYLKIELANNLAEL
jgi:cell division protein FtsL